MKRETVKIVAVHIRESIITALIVSAFGILLSRQPISMAKMAVTFAAITLGLVIGKLAAWRIGVLWDSLPYDHPFWDRVSAAISVTISMFGFIGSIPGKIKRIFAKGTKRSNGR